MRNSNKNLTKREIDVLRLCAKGYTNIQIGDTLSISTHTVKAHISSILEKLEVSCRLLAVTRAIRCGIIDEEL